MKYKIGIFVLCLFLLSGFFLYQNSKFNDGRLHVIFCDVGQGDGILIRTPKGSDIIVDAGPGDKILDCLANHMPFWDRDIELAFATHPDADHITGFASILESYDVDSFNTSDKDSDTGIFKKVRSEVSQRGVPARFLYDGDTFRTQDGVVIQNYWPTKKYASSQRDSADTNSFSLVQLISYGDFNVLLTGDIEKEILNTLFPRGISVDVFKLPHHGSKTGADDLTYKLIHPKLNILSVGKNNNYNHPSPEIISLLERYKQTYRRTDYEGDIEIISDGKKTVIVN